MKRTLLEKLIKAMRPYMVDFGNYLLSEERKSLYTGDIVEERLSSVNHADVENWLSKTATTQSI